MEKLCSGHVRANRLSTLAQAADCLAKAAVTLSEAARAAAEAFSSEVLDISSELNLVSGEIRPHMGGGLATGLSMKNAQILKIRTIFSRMMAERSVLEIAQ
ncbi:hypothetical protein OPQ81_002585 [Rhizoctonia solani]|nr:hypothetical protein OPQ81_002585 [Rhizoctonia solani]